MLKEDLVKLLKEHGYEIKQTALGTTLIDLRGRKYAKLDILDGEFKVVTKSAYWDLLDTIEFVEEIMEASDLFTMIQKYI
ncbi:MAG: hypothetical protein H0Z24_05735 [Thermosipho sp. (in: Bacteria)]|nr:hypothetical protein [Thermosipho sp. (in: thermotogales)]